MTNDENLISLFSGGTRTSVRAGLRHFGQKSTVCPLLAPYNTCEDLDTLLSALLRIRSGRGR